MNYKEQTTKSYNKNAAKFSEKFKGLMDLKRRLEFNRFVELLPGKNVLNLGTGGGDHSYYFSNIGLKVTAVDISKEMVKLCKEKGLNAIVMDIGDLKFKDGSFDGIWSVTSLLHVPKSKLSSVISKLHDILKNYGILYICIKEGTGEMLIKDKGSDTEEIFCILEKE